MVTFNQFKEELEAVCIQRMHAGVKIGTGRNCSCPLGMILGPGRYPTRLSAAKAWDITEDEAESFILGYEGCIFRKEDTILYKFYELGKAYRKKFKE